MDGLRRAVRNKTFRNVVAVAVIVLTIGLFGYYLANNPDTLAAVTSLDAATLVFLSLAYIVTIIANAFVLWSSLRLINKKVRFSENIALTGYSSVVNFFGPLQSGPGFRAAYLKQKHNVSLKRFFYVTVVFYGFFALLNGLVMAFALLLRASSDMFAVTLIGMIIAGAALTGLIVNNTRIRSLLQSVKLNDVNFWYIGLGAVFLAAGTTAAYFVELTHVDPTVTIAQTAVYAAAANLALFVSLTPGAIGFRESFLLLSERLHGIAPDVVITASIIDRAFYVVFLLVMFVALLAFGARSRLKRTQSIKSDS